MAQFAMEASMSQACREDPLTSSFASNPVWWAVASVLFALVGYVLAGPTPCSEVDACETMHRSFPSQFNACAAMGLTFIWLYEVINLVSTYRGVSETKALVPDIRSRCLPSLLLTVMFTVLVAQHATFAGSSSAWYASARIGGAAPGGAGAWPLYTITYVEWLCIVPLLLTAAGHCAIHRPLKELARPIVVTNFYIVLSWMAMLTSNEVVRWSLVAVSFAMYFHASWDMFCWVADYYRTAAPDLPSRNLRPCLSIGLVLLFAVYGVVFISALLGAMSTWVERMSFLFLDVGSKLAMGASFVVIRGNEYHRTLTSVLRRVGTSNVALVSILRGSFDFMLPCTVDAHGLCVLSGRSEGDMLRLESELGRPIAGKCLADLLVGDQERTSLAAYVRNTLRQADGHDAYTGATLSTQGEWTAGHLPPVAQVLNCRMACGPKAADGQQQRSVQCAVHLSVVPNSSFSLGRSVTHLVAAVRFDEEHLPNLPEDSTAIGAETGFEPFDAVAAEADGIVASLNDIANLGMSGMLKSVRGDSVSGDDDASTAPSTMSLSKLAGGGNRKQQVSTQSRSTESSGTSAKSITSQLKGAWRGRASPALGGYEQTFRFLDDGKHLQVALLGKTLMGEYTVDISQSPHQLSLQVLCDDGSCPPPIPYIFNLTKSGALHICGPADEGMQRPTKFEGPGFCILARAPPVDAKKPRAGSEFGAETASTMSRTECQSVRRGGFVRGASNSSGSMGGDRGVNFDGSRQTSSSSGDLDFGPQDLSTPAHLDASPKPSFDKQRAAVVAAGDAANRCEKPRAAAADGGAPSAMKNKYNDSMFMLQVAT
eukprot:CAMPEP_0170223606 /NCGR_PEP_ID=MMETSP0116_2-20130129/11503_1 /TAXON_ID=400756 /ORGANISM="Durinskia baltica, Strain CSIRO CS-38" /LENGTH=823 /DNA_ID=CAMNT_0010474309 /DNA_START=77 /DNA_END=2544 /DNA_ORIENTATION=-